MTKNNTLPSRKLKAKNTRDLPSLSELRELKKIKTDCSKRIEELKYKLFHLVEKHMDQAIVILKDWTKQ